MTPLWISAYLGLIAGAPIVFFFFVNGKRQDDLNEFLSYVDSQVQKERSDEVKSYQQQVNLSSRAYDEMSNKMKEKLREKDALLKQKEAELEKIRPLLKYLREPPPSS